MALLLLLGPLALACDLGTPKKAARAKRDAWTIPGEPSIRELKRTGRFADPRLREASGAVASATEPGVLWAQNDGGNEAWLFAFDTAGTSRGTVQVRGVENTDWEAIALGPCAVGACLYIGDVGDNYARREFVVVSRIPAPTTGAAAAGPAQSLSIVYADGARDVEAMWVAPDTSVWFATKRPERDAAGRWRSVQLYRVPAEAWSRAGVATAQLVDSLPIVPAKSVSRDWVTDASLSAVQSNGRRLLAVLTYGSVYVFDAEPATGRPTRQVARCAVPAGERNAEGITWMPDGRLMLVNERRGAALYVGRCP